MGDNPIPWPHGPEHRLSAAGTYFVTASTYLHEHHFRGKERLAVLHRGILKVVQEFGWELEAWAVFSNHYHFVGHSPAAEETAKSLRRITASLHEKTAKWVNRLDGNPGRRVWHNFWETRLTYEKSYLAFELHASECGEARVSCRCQSIPVVFGCMVRTNGAAGASEEHLSVQNGSNKYP